MLEDDGTKWLTAGRLIELLRQLPSDSRVIPNAVRNLLITDANGDSGIINFASGELEIWTQEDEES